MALRILLKLVSNLLGNSQIGVLRQVPYFGWTLGIDAGGGKSLVGRWRIAAGRCGVLINMGCTDGIRLRLCISI